MSARLDADSSTGSCIQCTCLVYASVLVDDDEGDLDAAEDTELHGLLHQVVLPVIECRLHTGMKHELTLCQAGWLTTEHSA